jgi:hypothetical protein
MASTPRLHAVRQSTRRHELAGAGGLGRSAIARRHRPVARLVLHGPGACLTLSSVRTHVLHLCLSAVVLGGGI